MADSVRFTYPVLSGVLTSPSVPTDYGEVLTSTKATGLAEYNERTLADTLGAIYAGASGTRRSGVLEGFAPSASTTTNMTIDFGVGLALWYSSGRSYPVVNRAASALTKTLNDPDLTNDRYDLITVRPLAATANYATRLVRMGDGTSSTMSLPFDYEEGCQALVYEGTPAGSPTVPSCALGDIPIALVRVQSGSPGLISASDVYDVRPWFVPHGGGTCYISICSAIDGTGAVTAQSVEISNPTTQVAIGSELARSDVGEYIGDFHIPLTFGAIASASWYETSRATAVASKSYTTASGTRNLWPDCRAYVVGTANGFNTLRVRVNFYNAAGSAADLDATAALNVLITLFRAD